jgi:hypothetical protein
VARLSDFWMGAMLPGSFAALRMTTRGRGRGGGRWGGAPAALAFQYALDASRAASNDRQIGLRWLIGCGAALFPIA